jgi:hypothetical protein
VVHKPDTPWSAENTRNPTDGDERVETSTSRLSIGPLNRSQLSHHEISPRRSRSGSSLDLSDHLEALTVHTETERGYSQAEEWHENSSRIKPASSPSTSLAGIGFRFPAEQSLPAERSLLADRSLEDLIRDSYQKYAGTVETKKWLPFDKLIDLVNHDAVHRELAQNAELKDEIARGNMTEEKLKIYTAMICGTHTDASGKLSKKPSRGIFAILVLMGMVKNAPEFMDAQLQDTDLPLKLHTNEKGQYVLCKYFDPSQVWSVGKDWVRRDFEYFTELYQIPMISPFFDIKADGVNLFDDFHDNVVLPFIESRHLQSNEGYHGHVEQIKIHPAHVGDHRVSCQEVHITFYSFPLISF